MQDLEMQDHRNITRNWSTSWRKRLQDGALQQTRLGTTRASQVRN